MRTVDLGNAKRNGKTVRNDLKVLCKPSRDRRL
jgi:hypothetical protein